MREDDEANHNNIKFLSSGYHHKTMFNESVNLSKFIHSVNTLEHKKDTEHKRKYTKIGNSSIRSVMVGDSKCSISPETTAVKQDGFRLTMGFVGDAISMKRRVVTATVCYDQPCFVSEKRMFSLNDDGVAVPISVAVTSKVKNFCFIENSLESNASKDYHSRFFTINYAVEW